MLVPSDVRYTPDVSETGFRKLYRSVRGLPPELGGEFWERFVADLLESPEVRSAVRVALTESGCVDE